jgi:hypothetical protein
MAPTESQKKLIALQAQMNKWTPKSNEKGKGLPISKKKRENTWPA